MISSMAPAVYGLIALALFGTAGYMAFGQGASPTSPQVFVPALGGVWFAARAALMIFRRT
jgi:hypothetical protein